MLWRDTATLIAVTHTENDMGDMIETETESVVFVNEKSVRQSEFYQAAATGFKPELMLEVRTEDYTEQRKVNFKNVQYNVIRVFSKNQEITELICQGLV